MRRAPQIVALVFGISLVCGAAVLTGLVDGVPRARAAVLLFAVAGAAHLGLAFMPAGKLRARWLVVPSLVAALLLLGSPPILSDDVYRYLFDGRCVVEGFAPYAHAPDSPKVADLVADLPGRINHAELQTIYPPVAQALFAVVAATGVGIVGWKVLLLGALFAAGRLTARVRPTLGATGTDAWIFSHPLALVTAAGNGNIDVLGLLALAAALVWANCARWWLVGVALGGGAGLKLFPIGLSMAALGRGGVRSAAVVLACALLVVAGAYGPFAMLGVKASGSLGTYAEAWEYNAFLHPLATSAIDWTLQAAGVADGVPIAAGESQVFYDGLPSETRWVARRSIAASSAKALSALALLGVVAVVWRRRTEFARAVTVLLVTLFLCSAVVHPWYLLWLVVPAVLSGSRFAVVWCSTALLAFWAPAVVADGGPWVDSVTIRAIQYALPMIVALVPCVSLTSGTAPA